MKILMVSQTSMPIPSPQDKIFAPGMFCYNLAKGLQAKGHKITVFATDDSRSDEIKIKKLGIQSTHGLLNLSEEQKKHRLYQHELFVLSSAFEEYQRGDYDLLHLNSFPISSYFLNFIPKQKLVTCTHHGIPNEKHDLKTDIDKIRQKKYYDRLKFIAVSEKQRRLGREYFNYAATVHHGIDINLFEFNSNPKNRLLFLGRMVENKNPHLAVEAALKSDIPLDLVGDIDSRTNYWQDKMAKHIDGQKIKYRGHCHFSQVSKYYGQAKALIFPITWDEAFGMVAIEAMACGTPVIAFDRGAMREIIKDGVTGFIVKEGDIEGMVRAVKNIDQIDRKKCREHIERNFTVERMVDDYEKVFQKIINRKI